MPASLEPLRLYEAPVQADWIDYNGHMNETYYLLIASKATDELIDFIGMDAAFRHKNERTIYTLETHIRYLKEVGQGELVVVETQILALDSKRFRLFHNLRHGPGGDLLCTIEMMMLHIDTSGPKAAPFEPGPKANLDEIFATHKQMPMPSKAGRGIGMKA